MAVFHGPQLVLAQTAVTVIVPPALFPVRFLTLTSQAESDNAVDSITDTSFVSCPLPKVKPPPRTFLPPGH